MKFKFIASDWWNLIKVLVLVISGGFGLTLPYFIADVLVPDEVMVEQVVPPEMPNLP